MFGRTNNMIGMGKCGCGENALFSTILAIWEWVGK